MLGGEKRIEDAVRLRDSGAIVTERNLDEILGAGSGNIYARPRHRFAHRVVSIVQDIQKHLLQLLRVANHVRQMLVKTLGDCDPAALQVIRA